MVELDSSIYLFLCSQCRAVGKGDTDNSIRHSLSSMDWHRGSGCRNHWHLHLPRASIFLAFVLPDDPYRLYYRLESFVLKVIKKESPRWKTLGILMSKDLVQILAALVKIWQLVRTTIVVVVQTVSSSFLVINECTSSRIPLNRTIQLVCDVAQAAENC